jgi:5-hydroxyisourate hydrolase-like protein (transthyretin family)
MAKPGAPGKILADRAWSISAGARGVALGQRTIEGEVLMGMRMWRMLVALLGVIGVAALAPQLALADAPVSGQVTDAVTGNGISGVDVNFYNASTGTEVLQVTTGTNGNYNLGSWPNGAYQVQFVDGGGRYAPLWYNGKQSQSQSTTVTVSGTTGVTVNQALQPDMVTGQVTDSASGQPISGVEVELLSNSGTKVAETTTDSGGNYSFSAIPAAVAITASRRSAPGPTRWRSIREVRTAATTALITVAPPRRASR